jgi:hypothetical protein
MKNEPHKNLMHPKITEVRTRKKKLGFWVRFGWETQNPKSIQKFKKSKIQTQKNP